MFAGGALLAATSCDVKDDCAPPTTFTRYMESVAEDRFDQVVGGEERLIDPESGTTFTRLTVTPTAHDRAYVENRIRQHRAGIALQPSDQAFVVYSGMGSNGEQLEQLKYVVKVIPGEMTAEELSPKTKEHPSLPAVPAKISPRLFDLIADSAEDDTIPIYVLVRLKPRSPLADPFELDQHVKFQSSPRSKTADERRLLIADRIGVRAREVAEQHEPIRQYLRTSGVNDSQLRDLWLTGAMAGELTPAGITALAQHPDVKGIVPDAPTQGATSNVWDGTNLRNGTYDGINAGLYRDGNYHGDGNNLKIGFIGDGFDLSHPAFDDWANGPSRWVAAYDCINWAWYWGQYSCPPLTYVSGWHETNVSSVAAADLLQNQVSGTPSFQLDRTGVAREADMVAVEGTSLSEMTAGLQVLIQDDVDIVNLSRGDDGQCQYDWIVEAWSEAVKAAHDAGMLVVINAGNTNPGGCSITWLAQATSGFVVGGVAEPLDYLYWISSIWADSSRGGMDARVRSPNGTYYNATAALSAVDAMAPAFFEYAAYSGGTFGPAGGTSISAPQVAGSALVVKDGFLTNGINFVDQPGVMFLALLSMTDRAYAQTSFRSAGFSKDWGGGRFQMRYLFGAGDHPMSGAWGHDLWETTIYQGQTISFPIRGSGTEPGDLRQFKVYAMVFEEDWHEIADVDLEVRDQNCGPGSSVLGYDNGLDVKSMVRLGTEAAGKALCVNLKGYAVPSPGVRVVLASYFSRDTLMR